MTVNPLIKIYVNEIKNMITFKIKAGHYLELEIPKTIKLLGRTKNKITKNKYGETVFPLENIDLEFYHFNNQ